MGKTELVVNIKIIKNVSIHYPGRADLTVFRAVFSLYFPDNFPRAHWLGVGLGLAVSLSLLGVARYGRTGLQPVNWEGPGPPAAALHSSSLTLNPGGDPHTALLQLTASRPGETIAQRRKLPLSSQSVRQLLH